MHNVSNLIFDLDGTISDPSQGITNSILYALAKLGAPLPPRHDLLRFIGPPLRHSFAELLPNEQIEPAIMHYRERYDAGGGMYENIMFPELPALLEALKHHGKTLYVATSKPHLIARKIIAHFALTDFFSGIYGPELDGTRNDKADLLAYLCHQEAIAPAMAVMIGDRKHDIIAANKNNMRSIGVLWGFGDEAELCEAGATTIIRSPHDILPLVLPNTA
jgi:phosphoglycolate phosphatase